MGVSRYKQILLFSFSTSRLLLFAFSTTIFLGSILLYLPIATLPPHISYIDALFTATSATCVTGLIVVDTPSAFTFFGKSVILFLIQAGGLGIMTFSFLPFLLLSKPLPFRGRLLVYETHLVSGISITVPRLILFLFGTTFAIEALGGLLLYTRLSFYDSLALRDPRWFIALFHSVSAYCNAGFALFSDNIASFKNDNAVVIIHALLIILGGVGFFVMYDVYGLFIKLTKGDKKRLSLHTKITLSVTISLLLIGTLLFYILERNSSLAYLTSGSKWINSFFHAATPRTAGFNTLDLSLMGSAAICLMLFLMFIGGSPGSTGGGIKTTTFGVLIGFVWSLIRGHTNVTLFGREIPYTTVKKAMALCMLIQLFLLFCFMIMLCVPLSGPAPWNRHDIFLPYLFEIVSAFGTVGLSLGVTAWLGSFAKCIIIVVMFIGRVGPLTLAFSIGGREKEMLYSLPEEDVMVG